MPLSNERYTQMCRIALLAMGKVEGALEPTPAEIQTKISDGPDFEDGLRVARSIDPSVTAEELQEFMPAFIADCKTNGVFAPRDELKTPVSCPGPRDPWPRPEEFPRRR